MKKKNRKNKSIILRIMILGVFIYMIATLSNLWTTLNQSQKELEALNQQKIAVQNDIEELKSLLEDGSHDKIIEKAARERLGFVYPDEQVFVDISGN